MPEDVAVPTSFFDVLAETAPELFGMKAGTKRPHVKVRSWLTALKKLSLLMGSHADGFLQHDIVRRARHSRCATLLALAVDVCRHAGVPALHSAAARAPMQRMRCSCWTHDAMHAQVRDYAISRCEDLKALQRRVLTAIMAGRPEPRGWLMRNESPPRGSAEWCVPSADNGRPR